MIERRIANYVADHGTNYTFASFLHPDTGRIVLSTDAPPSLVSELTSMSDPDQQREVSKAQVLRETLAEAWNRRDDISPFRGGAGIKEVFSVGTCSSGYAVRDSSATVLSVTAGHCFSQGHALEVESGNRSFGTVSQRRLPGWPSQTGVPMDVELVSGRSYAGSVYRGGIWSTTRRPVAGAGSAFVGYDNYCFSGRTTGEQCGQTAFSLDAQVCVYSDGCVKPAIGFSGSPRAQNGDSGGAFYALDSRGRALIRGHVIAYFGDVYSFAEPWTVVAEEFDLWSSSCRPRRPRREGRR